MAGNRKEREISRKALGYRTCHVGQQAKKAVALLLQIPVCPLLKRKKMFGQNLVDCLLDDAVIKFSIDMTIGTKEVTISGKKPCDIKKLSLARQIIRYTTMFPPPLRPREAW